MKKKSILLFLCICMLSACCKEDGEYIEEEKETFELVLTKQIVRLDDNNSLAEVGIVSGNGDYRIIYPKKMDIGGKEIDYSDSLLHVVIQEEKVIIKLLFSTEEEFNGYFLVTDKEGRKRLIIVEDSIEKTGNLINMDEVEQRLIDNSGYWQQ